MMLLITIESKSISLPCQIEAFKLTTLPIPLGDGIAREIL